MQHRLTLLLLPILLLLASCSEETGTRQDGNNTSKAEFFPAPGQTAALQFDHLSHVFGPVPSGTVVMKEYHCRNMGAAPVKIDRVITACPSCITIDYPQEPIPPGEVRTVTVRFDTKGKQGRFERLVSVVLEGDPIPVTLYLNGDVQAIPGDGGGTVTH